MAKRTIFIGDVHGCLDELLELMGILQPQHDDRVIFLGDIISKWPNSAGVISYIYKNGYECVLGNHELHYIQKHHLPGKYEDLRRNISHEEHFWMMSLPKYIEDGHFIAVHGGLAPNRHPSETPVEVLSRIRTWDTKKKTIGDEHHTPWYEFYTQTKPVFYGHWAVAGLNLRHNTFGLDSGCLYGKKLSAYIFETKELVQVDAKKTHCDID